MTDALIGAETLLLVLLLVLVAGLLRSHAEILRRLNAPAAAAAGAAAEQPPAGAARPGPSSPRSRPSGEPAPPVSGSTLDGDAVAISFTGQGPPTLLAFLSSGCSSCRPLFAEIGRRDLPGAARPVIVTRGSERESPAKLRALAPAGVPLLLSSEAWDTYAVPGSPYFVLVDGSIRGEGVATSWEALVSLLSDAELDLAESHLSSLDAVELRLVRAGIGPEDPSLRPEPQPQPQRAGR